MTIPITLITGGAGFIGSSLTRIFAAAGHRVIVLDRLTYAGHPRNLDGVECRLVEGDVCDAALLKQLFAEAPVSAVIHAAAESHVDNSIAGSAAFIETNIVGTHRVLEAALSHWRTLTPTAQNDFRYVQVSTDEVYGALGESGAFTHDTPMRPNSPYAASKAAADHLARAWHQTYGLPVLITRCCNNYGPRQHPEKLIPRMITNALKGEKLPVYGDGKQIREWIHVDDHARGVIAALTRGKPGEIYHLGSHAEIRNIALVQQLCTLLAQKTGRLGLDSLITHVTDRLGHDFRYALDTSATSATLGFTPQVTFAEGLAATVDWYLQNEDWVRTMQAWRGK